MKSKKSTNKSVALLVTMQSQRQNEQHMEQLTIEKYINIFFEKKKKQRIFFKILVGVVELAEIELLVATTEAFEVVVFIHNE